MRYSRNDDFFACHADRPGQSKDDFDSNRHRLDQESSLRFVSAKLQNMTEQDKYFLFMDDRYLRLETRYTTFNYTHNVLSYIHKAYLEGNQHWPHDKVIDVMQRAIADGLYRTLPGRGTIHILSKLIAIGLDHGISIAKLLPDAGFYRPTFGLCWNVSRLCMGEFVAMLATVVDEKQIKLPKAQINMMKHTKEYLIEYYMDCSNDSVKHAFLDASLNPEKTLYKIFHEPRGIRGTREGAINRLKRIARDIDGFSRTDIEHAPEQPEDIPLTQATAVSPLFFQNPSAPSQEVHAHLIHKV